MQAYQETTLLEVGLDNLNYQQKNDVYTYMASMLGKAIPDVTYADALDYYKNLKILDLSKSLDNQLAEGYTVTTNGKKYRLLSNDMFNMLGLHVMNLNSTTPDTDTVMFYTITDDKEVSHTLTEFRNVCQELFTYVKGIQSKFYTDRDTIKTCTTGTDVFNIKW